MKTIRPSFATATMSETKMINKPFLKVLTTFGVTLFVSLSTYATTYATDEIPVLIDGSSKLKTTLTLRGGDGSGGADAAKDSNGHYRLLDLIEKDKLDYFTHHYDPNQAEIREKLTRLYFIYFLNNRITLFDTIYRAFDHCSEIPYKYWQITGGNATFVKAFLKAYGFGNIVIDSNKVSFCPQGKEKLPYNFRLGLDAPEFKTLKWAFTDLKLESIDDEGDIRILHPESKEQLAIQRNGLVVISRKVFNKLDKESQIGLFTHEALLYAVSVLNPDLIKEKGTLLIRTYNRKLLKFLSEHDRLDLTQFPITEDSVVEAFQELEIPASKK